MNERTTTCPICIEEVSLHALEICGHSACMVCLKHWIEACEQTGQSMPTCPTCRNPVNRAEARLVLGRPFEPSGSRNTNDNEELDELTLQLLSTEAKKCRGCGSWIELIEGCYKMQCLCGYRFCWDCGAQGAECNCSPVLHVFWDNILRQNALLAAPPVATAEEHQNMRSFLAAHYERAWEQIRRERAELELEISFMKRSIEDGHLKIASHHYMQVLHMTLHMTGVPDPEWKWVEEMKTRLASLEDVDMESLFPGLERIAGQDDSDDDSDEEAKNSRASF